MSTAQVSPPFQSVPLTKQHVSCAHCGLPCPSDAPRCEGRSFCCLGCETVFSLLAEHGLQRFYELATSPGVQMERPAPAARFACLDDTDVQSALLDFADPRQARVTFHAPQIHCVACVWLLENLFRLHPGIGQSHVNFARREVAITFVPKRIKLSEVAALLASIGYEPALSFGELDKRAATPASFKRQWLQVGVAGFGFGNIMLMSLPVYFGLDSASASWFRTMAGWLGLALALPVLVFSAADFWRSAWVSARQRVMTLDVPIALGLAAIYGQSVLEVVSHTGGGYCDSLTGLIFFLLLGRLFQQKTHERLAFDRDYKGFFPLAVTRLRSSRREEAQPWCSPEVSLLTSAATSASEESVSIAQLAVGDRLVLRHGELLPADATLISGDACIDYSFVTGESEPVKPEFDERLYAGGRQTGGAIKVEVVKPVSESYLTSLWNSEAFRKTRHNDLDTLANSYSRRFTALIIAIAVGAAMVWLWREPARAMKAFTSVLIVACPCALALAAPFTLGTAQRLLGRLRVFLKNALVLERMAGVDTVVLDKTGTLTCASSSGVLFRPARRANMSLDPDLAGSLARHSTHPGSIRIAEALGPQATALGVRRFRETPGSGIEGEVSGCNVLLGSRSWLESRGVPVPSGSASAGSEVWLAVDGVCRGVFLLGNSLRPEVARLIERLRGRFELVLLSGDNPREEACFRELLGPDATLRFNQSPMDKLTFVQSLEDGGRRVMMVGDGLNDAGALKQATVGVAVVEQVGVFSPASDVIMDAGQLPRLGEVMDFARRVVRVVRAGFAVSALYNVVGVSIAAAGLLSPLVCAVLMPLSSASVVLFAVGATNWMARRSGFCGAANSSSTRSSRLTERAGLETGASTAVEVPA